MTDFRELLLTRRSIRDYQDREVPIETIREIIKDCTLAPSSSNEQPWRYIIIRDRSLMKRLSDESKKNLLAEIEKNPGHRAARYKGVLALEQFNVFYNAPALVILVGPKNTISLQVDLALAAAYFMFAAADRGLGTCWIALGSNLRDPALNQEVGLPEDYAIVAPIVLGYPKLIPTPSPRNQDIIIKEIG